MSYHVAQLNIAEMVAPLDDPIMRDFVEALDPINAMAETSRGFVWRLKDDTGDATANRVLNDPLLLVNMSVGEDLNTLKDFVYNSGHLDVLRAKRKWFRSPDAAHLVLWWVRPGHIPNVDEGRQRLEMLRRDGPAQAAFTFTRIFSPPHSKMVEIRLGVPADAGVLTEIAFAAKRHWGYPEDWIRLWHEDLVVTEAYVVDNIVYVAEFAGERVGFVGLDLSPGAEEVDHLWVKPEWMGTGVGRKLMRRALDHCSSIGVDCLHVVSDPHTQDFYCKLGAVYEGEQKSIPEPRTIPVLKFELSHASAGG
jgi:GNAT superfamily N-acetyltransferase